MIPWSTYKIEKYTFGIEAKLIHDGKGNNFKKSPEKARLTLYIFFWFTVSPESLFAVFHLFGAFTSD